MMLAWCGRTQWTSQSILKENQVSSAGERLTFGSEKCVQCSLWFEMAESTALWIWGQRWSFLIIAKSRQTIKAGSFLEESETCENAWVRTLIRTPHRGSCEPGKETTFSIKFWCLQSLWANRSLDAGRKNNHLESLLYTEAAWNISIALTGCRPRAISYIWEVNSLSPHSTVLVQGQEVQRGAETQQQIAKLQASIYALGWPTGMGRSVFPRNGEGCYHLSLSYRWVIWDTERWSDISKHKWGSLEWIQV